MGRGVKLVLFISVLFLSVQFISADPTISPSSFSANIYENKSFSISITNPYSGGSEINANITRVDITLPSGLVYAAGTDSTDSASAFSVASTTLSWINSSYVVGSLDGGDNVKNFGFYANVTTSGTLNISIRTTLGNGTVFESGIPLTSSDSSAPTVNLISPDNNADDTDGVLVFECNATDNIAVSSIKISITSNGSEIYSNTANFSTANTQRQTEWDYTFSSAGSYRWNCFANDTSNNLVWGANRTLTISAIANPCSPNWDCDESDWSVCTNDIQTRICNDLNSCGNNASKPAESKACALCAADWVCASWNPTECPKNGTQQRVCTDNNACSDATGKPSESRTCEPSGGNAWIFIAIILVLVLGGGAAALAFYFKNKNPSENMPQDNSGNQQQQNYGYSYQ